MTDEALRPRQKQPNQHAPRYDWDEILRVYAHLNGGEIAKIVGCTRAAVSLARIKRGLPSPASREGFRTDAEWREVAAAHPSSTYREIAQALSCPVGRVQGAFSRLGLKVGRREPTRVGAPKKLDEAKMLRLVELAKQGLSNKEIAGELDVHQNTIGRYRTSGCIPSTYAVRKTLGRRRNSGRLAVITSEVLAPMVGAGLSDKEIATKLGCTQNWVWILRQRYNLRSGLKMRSEASRPRRKSPKGLGSKKGATPDILRPLVESGMTDKEIGAKLGYHLGSIHVLRKTFGLPNVHTIRRLARTRL